MLSWLTPEERRGGVVLVIVLLLGAGWDVWRARRMRSDLASFPVPIVAPGRADTSAAAPGATAGDAPPTDAGRLDLNRATPAELEALPGIGPVLARRIVEARERVGRFGSLEELLTVRGVGPRLYERIRPMLAVSAPRAPMHSAASPRRGRADSASARSSTSR